MHRGGLNHAYSSGAINALKLANIIDYKITNEYIIETTYSLFDTINYYLEKKGIAIINKQFLDNIFFSINLDEEEYNSLTKRFPNISITLIK